MNADCFLDTNVLVYGVVSDSAQSAKRAKALELIETKDFALSAQVLQEFWVTVTRKLDRPLAPAQAMEWIDQFDAFPCIPIDAALVRIAIDFSVRYRISYWDGAVLAAAQRAGVVILYTEDLNDGQFYDSVRVLNPFADGTLVQDAG